MRHSQWLVAGGSLSTVAGPLSSSWTLWKASGEAAFSVALHAGPHQTGFTACHASPNASFSSSCSTLCWVKGPSPFFWETTIFSSLLAPPLHQLTTPTGCLTRWHSGSSPESPLSTHVYPEGCGSASNHIVQSLLFWLVFTKTCLIFPTTVPSVQQRWSLPTDLTSLRLLHHHGYDNANIKPRRPQVPPVIALLTQHILADPLTVTQLPLQRNSICILSSIFNYQTDGNIFLTLKSLRGLKQGHSSIFYKVTESCTWNAQW